MAENSHLTLSDDQIEDKYAYKKLLFPKKKASDWIEKQSVYLKNIEQILMIILYLHKHPHVLQSYHMLIKLMINMIGIMQEKHFHKLYVYQNKLHHYYWNVLVAHIIWDKY